MTDTKTGAAPTRDEIENAIDAWHEAPENGVALHEHLGWTREEYEAWMMDPARVPARPLGAVRTV